MLVAFQITQIQKMKKNLVTLCLLMASLNLFATKHIVVSPDGEVGNGLPNGTQVETVVFSLVEAHSYIINNLSTNDIINEPLKIFIRGGVYYNTSIWWKVSSPIHELEILAYPGEVPIFDGRKEDNQGNVNDNERLAKFLNIQIHEKSKIILNGLTIRNYRNGIEFIGSEQNLNGNNKVINCIFDHIGTKYFDAGDLTGYSAIGIVYSNNNIIEGNIFNYIENKKEYRQSWIHAIYLSHNGSDNTIKNNYINMCSGDPIKLRNGSNNNKIINNYIENSGIKGFVRDLPDTSTEVISSGTTGYDNIFLFSYPFPIDDYSPIEPFVLSSYSSIINNIHYGDHPECGKVADMTSGDINGDGIDELFVAFNYSGRSIIVRNKSGNSMYLSEVIHYEEINEITALEFNDFNNDGVGELIAAFKKKEGGALITKGDGISSATNFYTLYDNPYWTVSDFTSGDFDQDGRNELITAFNNSSQTQIHRGNGEWSVGNLASLYSSSYWRTKALIAGDFDNDGKEELTSSFHAPGETQIHRGNGKWSVGNLGLVNSTDFFEANSLSAGDFNNDGITELVTAFNNDNETQIHSGNGIWSTGNHGNLYKNTWWRTGSLIAGRFENSGTSMISAFNGLDKIQIHHGNATSSVGNFGLIYEIPFVNNGCELSQRPSSNNSYESTSTFYQSNDISTNKYLEHNSIEIYPNPANDFITVNSYKEIKIEFIDSSGRILKLTENIKNGEVIDLTDLPKGLYVMKITSDNATLTKRLLIN